MLPPLRVLVVVLIGFFAAALAGAPATAQGLDVRPTNRTCVAKAVPIDNTLVRAAPAFPGLTFLAPTQVRQHPTDLNRWYVSERGGLLKTFVSGSTTASVALDLRPWMALTAKDVSDSQQWGVTSFVFHPDWAAGQTHIFLVANHRTVRGYPVYSVLYRFTSYDNGQTFDPASVSVVLAIPQYSPWHHFGQIQVGPWNQLFLGSGDGSGTLPNSLAFRAQDWGSYYGGIYMINPWVAGPTLGNGITVFAKGFRNPWRFSFDRATNWLWVGDVGEDSWEEVNQVGYGGNYGWPLYEGPECRQSSCNPAYLQAPVHTFDHSEGAAAIGGYVYRGTDIPALYGYYVFGSASHPRLWALTPDNRTRVEIGSLTRGMPTGFYEDNRGELYVIDTPFNAIWKLLPGSGTATGGTPMASYLSQTGCVDPGQPQNFASGVIPFDVNNPLWSDGTDKKRGFALPEGARITVRPTGDFDLPVRSVAIKSFSYQGTPIETRLFMRHPQGGGWRGYSYEWVGNDAALLSGGKVKQIGDLTWQYPSREQCAQCHTPAAGATLGLEVAQLNRDFTYPSTGRTYNQIDTLKVIGAFQNNIPWAAVSPALATRTSGTATDRARAYLHSNCSFCHRPGGNAQANMDLRYWKTTQQMNVCWQPPLVSNLGDPSALLLTPGSPEKSILLLRMWRRDGYGMPPLATTRLDWDILGSMDTWVRTMPGTCP
ncbi:MAG: PQQ-dependent sugar dehydrogenase [Rhodospirillales bacterium]